MVRPRTFIGALLGPAAAAATAVALASQYLIVGHVSLVSWTGIALVWLTGIGLRAWRRTSRVNRLLEQPARPMRRLRGDFGVVPRDATPDAFDEPAALPSDLERQMMEGLASRRLVLLDGDGPTAARAAYTVLRREFGDFLVLRPKVQLSAGAPPLTALLTSVGSVRHDRYILWLEDIDPLLNAGLDPRIIERWLATGRGRVAVGTINSATYARLIKSGTSIASPLARAFLVRVDAGTTAPREIADRFRAAREHPRQQAAVLMRLVATWRLLGISERPERDLVARAVRAITGGQLSHNDVARACEGAGAPLEECDGVFEPHPDLMSVVDLEDGGQINPAVLSELTELVHDNSVDFVAMARALAHRGQIEDAVHLMRRAERVATDVVRPVLTSAWVDLVEQRDPSGVALGNTGGLDFEERMGPQQRQAAQYLLPGQADDVFDPSLPPETEGRRARFYRLTLRRAVARVVALMFVDAFAILVASAGALAVRAADRGTGVELIDPDLGKLFASAAPLTIAVAAWIGLYRRDAARARVPQILATMTLVSTIVAAGFFVADVRVGSMTALGFLFAAAVLVDWALRAAYDGLRRKWVRRHQFQTRVLMLGEPKEVRPFARNLERQGARPVQIVACLSPSGSDDPFDVGRSERGGDGYRRLEAMLHELHIGELVIADRSLSTTEKGKLTGRAHRLGVDVRFVANDEEIILGAIGRVDDDGLVRARAAVISPESHELKRLVDWVIVTASLPLWGSIILLYAAHSRIRRRGQPVFVAVDRVGAGGTGYSLFRLRTRVFHDDRTRGIHPTGRVESFMEQIGLDELPQVINVLRGEMSLVGPRPLTAREVAQLSPDQRRTLAVRPGMTGPWQVSRSFGLSEADMRAADAEYLRHWRVMHDLAFILRTPVAVGRRHRYLGDTEIARQRRYVRGEGLEAGWT